MSRRLTIKANDYDAVKRVGRELWHDDTAFDLNRATGIGLYWDHALAGGIVAHNEDRDIGSVTLSIAMTRTLPVTRYAVHYCLDAIFEAFDQSRYIITHTAATNTAALKLLSRFPFCQYRLTNAWADNIDMIVSTLFREDWQNCRFNLNREIADGQ